MFSLMLFMLCFFVGFAILFFYLYRLQERYYRQLSDEHAQLRVLLRAAESRLDYIVQHWPLQEAAPDNRQKTEDDPSPVKKDDDMAGHDPLLHLSFEEPTIMREKKTDDPALELNLDNLEEIREQGKNQI